MEGRSPLKFKYLWGGTITHKFFMRYGFMRLRFCEAWFYESWYIYTCPTNLQIYNIFVGSGGRILDFDH